MRLNRASVVAMSSTRIVEKLWCLKGVPVPLEHHVLDLVDLCDEAAGAPVEGLEEKDNVPVHLLFFGSRSQMGWLEQ